MSWLLQCPEGQTLALPPQSDVIVGSGSACTLRLRGEGVPATLATLLRDDHDAWLQVKAAEPQVGVNGRPVRALARLAAGDRICFGSFCVDLLGERAGSAAALRPVQSFALRARGGAGNGRLQPGPTLHLAADGGVVSAAAGSTSLTLVDDAIRLDPGGTPVKINGYRITAVEHVRDGDQIQVGARRYQVEATGTPFPDAVTERLPAMPVRVQDPRASRGEFGALWWLIGIAGAIAALASALLYYHG